MANSQEGILLTALITNLRQQTAPDLNDDQFFELFLNEQVLKEFDLSYDELSFGNIGNGNDGGIDGFFIFVNGILVQPDTTFNELRKNIVIDLYLLQAKNTDSFDEKVLDKFIDSAGDIFDLAKETDSLRSVYNKSLLQHVDMFRTCYLKLIDKQPQLKIHYFYGSKGAEVHPKVERKVNFLFAVLQKFFNKCDFKFEFLGAKELINVQRKEKKRSYELKIAESAITTNDGGYICISSLNSYYNFITDDDNEIVKHIFDANVRDHQKSTSVNKDINITLSLRNPEDFWWLNNGITIITEKAISSGKRLTIREPQIVNGCQTSFEIYNYFKSNPENLATDDRNLMIRIIETSDDSIKSRIIKSTNSQTNIPAASLRSTDVIHRNIEEYFANNGLYYDRRKNFWKNQDKPISSIITIPYLSQSIISMILKQPDYARARPSTLLNQDVEYKKIFNEAYPLDIYLKAVRWQKHIDSVISFMNNILERGDASNIKWFVSMMVVSEKYQRKIFPTSNLLTEVDRFNKLDIADITDGEIIDATLAVHKLYHKLGGTDQVAKNSAFTEAVIELINKGSGKNFVFEFDN